MPETPPKPMGRPPIPEAERRAQFLRVRISAAELEAIRHAAESRGESVSDYARAVLLRHAKRSRS